MTADDFEDRVARLEEHLVSPEPQDHLKRAEELLARGDTSFASLALATAKLARTLDELEAADDDA